MRFALLSAGPSLRRADPAAWAGATVIAVNTAAALHPCTWWSCGDDEAIEKIVNPIGVPHIWTMDVSHDRVQAHDPDRHARHRWLTWQSVQIGQPFHAYDYSAPAAIVLAVHLGATKLDIFGVDMAGETDCYGTHWPGRGADRWAKERPIWRDTIAWAARQGVSIKEHKP